jgi:hypothetical protein
MGKLFDSITTYLEADGWTIQQVGDELMYSMTVEGENGSWPCIAQVFEEDDLFVFYSACPVVVPEEKRGELLEMLNDVNYNLVYGNFEMDSSDGHIRFRTSIDITGHDLGAFLIQQIVYRNVRTMDIYLPIIKGMANY